MVLLIKKQFEQARKAQQVSMSNGCLSVGPHADTWRSPLGPGALRHSRPRRTVLTSAERVLDTLLTLRRLYEPTVLKLLKIYTLQRTIRALCKHRVPLPARAHVEAVVYPAAPGRRPPSVFMTRAICG